MIENREFRRIYALQVLIAVADAMGMSFMALYAVKRGLRLEDLLEAMTLAFAMPVILIALMRRARAKLSFCFAFAAKVAAYAIAFSGLGPCTLDLVYMSNALVLVFFWIPYNLEFFSYASERSRAFSGSLAMAVYPFVGCLVPPLAAHVWAAYGFGANMLAAVAVLVGASAHALLNRSIRFRAFDYRIGHSLRKLVRYRALFLLQGIYEASVLVGVPVFTLLFIRTEVRLGVFFSYLGLLSMLATIALARLSDRTRRRTAFLYPTVFLAAGATMAMALGSSAPVWVGLAGLFQLSNILVVPFLISVALDAPVGGIDMWAGRELLLNLGRALGSVLMLIAYRALHDHRPAFLVLGAALLAFALLIHIQRIYPKVTIVPAQPAR
ncbi:MAG: hypothetical protein JXR96_30095 [Deltaproteobacteria bacterium]|nr:hypothetical protein [Deltaproteobacteria bacterium]